MWKGSEGESDLEKSETELKFLDDIAKNASRIFSLVKVLRSE